MALHVILNLVVAVHLLAVNLAAAGPLVCIWLHVRARCGDAVADAAGRKLAWCSLWALVAGVLLGFAALGLEWLLPDSRWLDALFAFPPRKLWFSLAELACSLLWTAAYAGLWNRMRSHPWLHALLAVLTATNLLYHFPALLSAVSIVAARPETADVLTAQTTSGWLSEPEIASRVVHVWLASIATAGVALMGIALRLGRNMEWARDAKRLAVSGARIAMIPTLAQLLAGLWVTLSLPAAAQSAVMGGDWLAATMLGASVLASLGLMYALGAAAMGEAERRQIVRSMILLAIVVLLMTSVVRHLRSPRISRQFEINPKHTMLENGVQARPRKIMVAGRFWGLTSKGICVSLYINSSRPVVACAPGALSGGATLGPVRDGHGTAPRTVVGSHTPRA